MLAVSLTPAVKLSVKAVKPAASRVVTSVSRPSCESIVTDTSVEPIKPTAKNYIFCLKYSYFIVFFTIYLQTVGSSSLSVEMSTFTPPISPIAAKV